MKKLSVITLGVSNPQRSIRFYEMALELKRIPYESDSIAFFDLDGPRLALYSKGALAEDAGVSSEGRGFSGITFAQNVGSSTEVTELLQQAVNAG